ncbi:MAG: hypothetical protein RLZZ244_1036 [Verrucomicrobiota bacterium]|jgi:outer membrane protein OmpA-like peptidoglycan-associated protein
MAINAPRRSSPPQAFGWYVLALLLSLGLHAALWVWSGQVRLRGWSENRAAVLVPPRFVVKQVQVDPKAFEAPPEAAKPAESKVIPVEALVFSDAQAKPKELQRKESPVEMAKDLFQEKPRELAKPANLQPQPPSKLGVRDADLKELTAGLLQAPPVSRAQPVLAAAGKGSPNGLPNGVLGGSDSGIPGRQSLEDALSRMTVVPTRETPVAVGDRALFAYDSAELTADSLPSLEKIAQFKRNFPADYVMVIVGHTDALGAQDYNLRLSQRRAEAVRDWLIKRYDFNPATLKTLGRGALELLVPADKSVEEQAPNRRVEISFEVPSAAKPLKKAR